MVSGFVNQILLNVLLLGLFSIGFLLGDMPTKQKKTQKKLTKLYENNQNGQILAFRRDDTLALKNL